MLNFQFHCRIYCCEFQFCQSKDKCLGMADKFSCILHRFYAKDCRVLNCYIFLVDPVNYLKIISIKIIN